MVQPLDQFVDALRRVAQDVLVPEFRTMQAQLEHHDKHLESLDRRAEAQGQALVALGQGVAVLNQNVVALNGKMEAVEHRLDGVLVRLDAEGQSLAALNAKVEVLLGFAAEYKEVARPEVRLEALERDMASLKGRPG